MTKQQKITLSASRDIPFNKLMLSQSNVRHVKAGVSIEELAEDIARRTLLSSITVRRCCKSLTTKDSLRESMALDAVHEQAISRPLSHDELVQLQRVAQEAGVSTHLGRQGHDLARAA